MEQRGEFSDKIGLEEAGFDVPEWNVSIPLAAAG